jgi:methylthioribose-1-phosphate isomerase
LPRSEFYRIGTYLKALAADDNGVPFYVRAAEGKFEMVQIVPDGSPVANYAFDVTPARLVSGLNTERGVLQADRAALVQAFFEQAKG